MATLTYTFKARIAPEGLEENKAEGPIRVSRNGLKIVKLAGGLNKDSSAGDILDTGASTILNDMNARSGPFRSGNSASMHYEWQPKITNDTDEDRTFNAILVVRTDNQAADRIIGGAPVSFSVPKRFEFQSQKDDDAPLETVRRVYTLELDLAMIYTIT